MKNLSYWTKELRNISIICACTIVSFIQIHQASFTLPFDYEPIPDTGQEHYNKKYPIQHVHPSYFNGCSSIKERRFTSDDGFTFHGELNGKGRSWAIHHYATCSRCRMAMMEDFREVLREVLREIKTK